MVTDEFVMVHPSYFDVLYDINPYMGGEVDTPEARDQWRGVREAMLDEEATVHTVRPDEIHQEADLEEIPSQLPDMVFAANHGAFISEDTFLRATLANEERQPEEDYVDTYIRKIVDSVSVVTPEVPFEGYGDVYRDDHTETLWLGYGQRSEYEYMEFFQNDAYETIQLELTNEWFYHLDTCLFVIDSETALIEERAFTQTTIDKISKKFDTVHLCNTTEDSGAFLPCNSIHLPDGTILTAPENKAIFEHEVGLSEEQLHYVDVSEFHKSGGSIRCLVLPIETPPHPPEEQDN